MSVLAYDKRLVNRALAPWGHTVAHSSTVPSFDRLAELLARAGLTPKTVVDIGVAYGTPWLYEAFPKAAFHLVDPTRESLPHMQRWAESLDAEIHNFGLGDVAVELEIAVRPEIGGSSLFAEVGNVELSASYKVPIRRFDEVFGRLQRPLLCKIDVQGAELMVLRGMGERMAKIDVLIVETSLIATLQGDAPEFAAVHAFMNANGHVLYDLVGITRRPLDGALAQVDAVFVPASSALRQDKRWAN